MSAAVAYTTDPDRYWEHQRPIGELGGELNLWKFAPHIATDDVVVDFGCGGGFLLARLACQRRIGVDPSPLAREEAIRQCVETAGFLDQVAAGIADVVVSNHALEHTLRPLDELRKILRVLRPDGKLVLAVPLDDWRSQRHPDPADPNRHLYAWTPLLLGNLLDEAGFHVESVRVSSVAWHPRVTPRLPRLFRRPVGMLLSRVLRRRELIAVATHQTYPGETYERPGTPTGQ
jgi:SAM-dependent methyltransferase